LPELSTMAGMRLERANVSYQLTNRIAMLFGPPLAGVLVAMIGASNVLWFNGATFVLSMAAIIVGVPRVVEAVVEQENEPPQKYLQEVKEGFRFIFTERTIFWLLASTSIGSLIAEPFYSVIMPVYGREVLDSAVGLGLAFSGLALGSIVGNLFYAWKGLFLPRRAIVIGGYAGRALIFVAIVLQPGTLMLAFLLFLSGVILEPVNPIMHTILQERVPARMRGRVFSASAAVGMGSMPLGNIAYGFLMEYTSLQATLAILAGLNLALPVIMWMARPLRSLEPVVAVDVAPQREPVSVR
jgi:predicted MFS family arabinose efflux permease